MIENDDEAFADNYAERDQAKALREQALSVPPAVIDALGASLAELEDLHRVLTTVNAKALAAGALKESR